MGLERERKGGLWRGEWGEGRYGGGGKKGEGRSHNQDDLTNTFKTENS